MFYTPFDKQFQPIIINGSIPEPNSGCWLWVGAYRPKLYGVIASKRFGRTDQGAPKQMSAHRVSWVAFNGPIPPGMLVCHKCDVTLCVNPAHLFLGSAKDNVQDSKRKGRIASAAHRAKISEGKRRYHAQRRATIS